MNQYQKILISSLLSLGITLTAIADDLGTLTSIPTTPTVSVAAAPIVTPNPPPISAQSYILIDVNSGKIIAEKNSTEKLPPASLTKMMTLYVISNALSKNQIHLDDQVRVSEQAWRTGGSRMFIKEGQYVPVEDLLKGIIVHSGNDACVAMAEHVGSSEESFAEMMNEQAARLGMSGSHFSESTGLPDPNNYTTARDLAILGTALIKDFPQYYHWYKQKWYTYNGIRQANRNRLLWRDEFVDGIKTGHTNEAGFCLVSSALKDNMRLLAVVMNAPSDSSRAEDSQKLINYGFRFFETHKLYNAGQTITTAKIYKGKESLLKVGMIQDQYITIPTGQYKKIKLITKVPQNLVAPIQKGDKVGEFVVQLDNKDIQVQPLFALDNIEKAGILGRMKDSIKLAFINFIHKHKS
jgi:serine-type D-Ala-D-Ala carboxypeptidase (penicillin-binding protein 5/6)